MAGERSALGAAEMAAAIAEGRSHRASAALGCHVLDVLDGIVRSDPEKRCHQLVSTFSVPAPLAGTEQF